MRRHLLTGLFQSQLVTPIVLDENEFKCVCIGMYAFANVLLGATCLSP